MNLDNFVTKNQAVLLAELNFEDATFAYYDESGLNIDKYFGNPDNLNSKFTRFNKLETQKYSAPTVDQALNWIFDEFNLFIQYNLVNGRFNFYIYNLSNDNKLMFKSDVLSEKLYDCKRSSLSHILTILEVSFLQG